MRVKLLVLATCLTSCAAPDAAVTTGALAGSTVVTAHDTIPNFAFGAAVTSARDGRWADPTTWTGGAVPTASDSVLVTHTVTIDDLTAVVRNVGVDERGVLRFAPTVSTRLLAANLAVLPGGALEVGTEAAPIDAAVRAEIVIRDVALDAADTGQFGTGFIAFGRVEMHGAVRSATFVRLARAPAMGDTTLLFSDAVSGWRSGDRIVVPDSRQVRTEDGTGRNTSANLELLTLMSVSPDGRTATLAAPLAHDHPGSTDQDADGAPDLLPHAANVTRNVVVRSENRAGTRGHVLFTDRADIDVRYVGFEGLGRTTFDDLDAATNHIGRYALHIHHLYGPFPTIDPEYQYRLIGNAIWEDSPTTPRQKWGITLHDAHHGLIRDNVVYNVAGAGIVTEDGSESFNVFDHNFVARVTSNGGRDEHLDSTRGIGREGVGFWFRGSNNYVRNNVATNMGEEVGDVEAAYGFKYNMVYLGDVHIPRFRGASTDVDGEYDVRDGNSLPLLEFANNEMYGLIQGLTIWWLCANDTAIVPGCGRSVLRGTRIWHTARYAFYGYPAYNFEFDDLAVYGDPDVLSSCCEFASDFWYGDYLTQDMTVRNSRFYDTGGYTPPYFRDGSIRIENSHFRTRDGVIHLRSAAPGSCASCDLPDADVVLVNDTFEASEGFPLVSISLGDHMPTDPANADRLFSCNHAGVVGDHFEVFFDERSGPPCTTTRADVVDGYACATPAAATACAGVAPPDRAPPSTPPGLVATAVSTSEIMLTWSASTDDVAVAGYELFRCTGGGCDPVTTIAMPTGTSYLDGGLAARTTYRYRVLATDTSGNDSPPSAPAEATTLDGPGGPDGGGVDGGSSPRDGGPGADGGSAPGGDGCGCRAGSSSLSTPWALVGVALSAVLAARRR